VSIVEFELRSEHLEACDWRSVLESCSPRECRGYSFALYRTLNEAGAELPPSDAAAFRFIAGVCAGMLTPEKKEPFAPMIVMRNGRSALPSDLSDHEVELLPWLVENARDHPDLRARAADYLWLRTSDYRMAEAAIDAYFEAAPEFEREGWGPAAVARLSRALGLAAQLGKRTELFRKTLARVETIADRRDETLSDGLVVNLLELVLSFGGGEPAVFADHASLRAERAAAAGKTLLARSYWGLAAKWRSRGGDPAGEREARTRLAEGYVRDAESALAEQPSNYMAASSHIEHAIEAFRRLGGNKDRVAELRSRMEEAQLKSREQLKLISESVDVSQFAQQAIDFVKGMPLLDALQRLALGHAQTKKATVREQVIELSQQTPLQFLIPLAVVDASQRVIARRGSMRADQPGYEEALEAEMFRHAADYQVMTANSYVEPARQQIWSEHPCAELDVAPLVSENPFVPPGREYLFLRGLHAGLAGDFLQSTHVLGLQLENSVRHILKRSGVRTTTLQDGIEKLMTLDTLLALTASTEIFGEDMVFNLRALLTEPFGSNLRHRLAHALMNDGEFHGPLDVYLWWIVLQLCCIPIEYRKKAAGASTEAEQEKDASAVESPLGESAKAS
jgi:hypothetical protein